MITVAVASENGSYDGEIYRCLLGRMLATEIHRWDAEGQIRFTGCKSVVNQAPLFLKLAAREGIRHALVAIDNDGGARRGPEHEDGHDIEAQAENEDGCRVCRLMNVVPADWRADPKRHCVVVPVQTVETWLLCLAGHAWSAPSPEQCYHRRVLKKAFLGSPQPPEKECIKRALSALARQDALVILRQRRSFCRFESQLVPWRNDLSAS